MDTGKAIPEVGAVLDSVNGLMGDMGFDEKLRLRTNIQIVTLTVGAKLTEEQQQVVKTVMESHMVEAMPQYDLELTDFKFVGTVE
jgi:hypothetical protein